jgi:hypothetical protein
MLVFFFFFETGSHCLARLAGNLRSSCLSLVSAGIAGVPSCLALNTNLLCAGTFLAPSPGHLTALHTQHSQEKLSFFPNSKVSTHSSRVLHRTLIPQAQEPIHHSVLPSLFPKTALSPSAWPKISACNLGTCLSIIPSAEPVSPSH